MKTLYTICSKFNVFIHIDILKLIMASVMWQVSVSWKLWCHSSWKLLHTLWADHQHPLFVLSNLWIKDNIHAYNSVISENVQLLMQNAKMGKKHWWKKLHSIRSPERTRQHTIRVDEIPVIRREQIPDIPNIVGEWHTWYKGILYKRAV